MYDLKALKAIPIKDMVQKYGIEFKEKGNDIFCKLRGEKTASCHIDTKRNLWHDFGSGKGGSVIDFLSEIEGISAKEAINKLAEDYGFSKGKVSGWNALTDSQYNEIGIKAEKATLNFEFNLDKHSIEQLERWSKKYSMSVKDLALKYPDIYNRMVEKLALKHEIDPIREGYQSKLKMYLDPSTSKADKPVLKGLCIEDAKVLSRKVELLNRAVIDSKNRYDKLLINTEKDFAKAPQSINKNKASSQEVLIKNRVVKAYTTIHSFNAAEMFSVEQAIAIHLFNAAVLKKQNTYLSIPDIKEVYMKIGKNIEMLENKRKDLSNAGSLDKTIAELKDLFNKGSKAVDAIKEVNMSYKNEAIKQDMIKNPIKKIELTH